MAPKPLFPVGCAHLQKNVDVFVLTCFLPSAGGGFSVDEGGDVENAENSSAIVGLPAGELSVLGT